MPVLRQRLHRELQHTVDAVLHHHFGAARFDVNVTRPTLERREDNRIHQPDDGTHARIARKFVDGDVFVALILVADDLEGEAFRSLVEHALRLFGALQQVGNLRRRCDFDLQPLAEQER